MDLRGSIGVVTGGASGIGLATAELLLDRGTNVILWDAADNVEDVAASIGAKGLRVDVTNPAAVRDAAQAAGEVRLLVSSAGVGSIGNVWEVSDEEWSRVLDVNLHGVFLCIREISRRMVEGGGGRIVNVASASGAIADPGMAAYCTSKAAVIMLTKVAALDLAQKGILVNAVAPGPIDTPLLQMSFIVPGVREAFERIPVPRLGTPDEVARAIVFLLESDWITGETLFVDGGAQLGGPLGAWDRIQALAGDEAPRRTSWES
ncbi:MAG: SDR family NAD(P)-dependent oxidoreductase [Actinomycetota bacterium]|nr:SDR family oxidoreductase [Actinomycetota bacterium]